MYNRGPGGWLEQVAEGEISRNLAHDCDPLDGSSVSETIVSGRALIDARCLGRRVATCAARPRPAAATICRMVGDSNTGGARIVAPSGNAPLWYLDPDSAMGESPIAESGSRYHNQYLSEGLKILATHPQRQSHSVRHSSVDHAQS